jgi:hypothetical protein
MHRLELKVIENIQELLKKDLIGNDSIDVSLNIQAKHRQLGSLNIGKLIKDKKLRLARGNLVIKFPLADGHPCIDEEGEKFLYSG